MITMSSLIAENIINMQAIGAVIALCAITILAVIMDW